jgi:hypothetical protein
MDTTLKNLKGSPSRDLFKQLHKKGDKVFYACDIDFCLVGKYPPRIVAYLDVKTMGDTVTFSEVIAYNELIKLAPLYLVYSENIECGVFGIWKYTGGDWHPDPPIINSKKILDCNNWNEFYAWERELRR